MTSFRAMFREVIREELAGSQAKSPERKSGLMTKKEAADELQVCVRTVEHYIADGRLPVVKVGGNAHRIDPADLRKLIELLKERRDEVATNANAGT